EDSGCGLLEQYVFVSVEKLEEGTWEVHSNKPLTDGRLMDVAELPVIDQLNVVQDGSNHIAVDWQASHARADMKVMLYLSEDAQTDTGRLLTGELSSSGSTNIQLPDALPSGEYYIRAVLMDGDELLHD